MSWLLLGVALLVGALLVGRWFVGADTKQILKALRWAGAILAVVLALVLVLTGRFSLLWIAFMGLLPWIMRLRMLGRMARSARGPSSGGQSSVNTRFVAMTLDHDTGDMDGEVLEGAFAGRQLSRMTMDEVLKLFTDASRADEQSANILGAYLDRQYGDAWRERAGSGNRESETPRSADGRMTVEEAYRILDLEPNASREEINRQHRELMKKMHPDHGGSDYLAAKINEARECLMRLASEDGM
ncbi:MAG: DnaJ domain-containing protein [Alphaproteobacteria bacterium]